jgi:aliphatic nitrilase
MFAFQPDIYQLSIEANATVTRSYALEGQSYVLCSTQVIGKLAVDTFCDTEERRKNLPVGGGWARIYGPDGSELAKPLPEDAEGILYAEIDLSQILYAKAGSDPTGHYARPDVLSVTCDARNHSPVRYVGADGRADINNLSRVESYRLRLGEQKRAQEVSSRPQLDPSFRPQLESHLRAGEAPAAVAAIAVPQDA